MITPELILVHVFCLFDSSSGILLACGPLPRQLFAMRAILSVFSAFGKAGNSGSVGRTVEMG